MNYSFIKTPSGADIYELELPDRTEYCFIFKDGSIQNFGSLIENCIKGQQAAITNSIAFGGPSARLEAEGINVLIRDKFCEGAEISSIQSSVVSSTEATPVIFKGKKIGFIVETENSRQCRLCGIIPEDSGSSRGEQVRQVFNTMRAALEMFGFKFTDTIRTWFYIDHIQDWYAEFNRVRTEFYTQDGIFNSILPASTGIGAGNPAGTALCADLLAIQPKNAMTRIEELPSPMQPPATTYKSSFSRGIKIIEPGFEKLIVSGTASIGKDGKTEHVENPEGQIELTMDVIKAILETQGMGWNSIFRSIAYFTDKKFVPLFETCLKKKGIRRLPTAYVFADICRADLLFEIELDAIHLETKNA